MRIDTKYNVGEVVQVGNHVVIIKDIEIRVGLVFPHFDRKQLSVHYRVETAKGLSAKIPEFFIIKKATTKAWIKAGGRTKEIK